MQVQKGEEMKTEPIIVTSWDSMPPEVYAEGEVYSTRVLAAKYKKMENALKELKSRFALSPHIQHEIDEALK